MKIRNAIIVLFCFAFLSCSTNRSDSEKISYMWPKMVEQLTQREFDTSIAMDELKREKTDKKIPFTMNFDGCQGKPVISDNENKVFFMVDSGCTRNWFYPSVLKKYNISDDEFMESVVKRVRETEPELSKQHPSDDELKKYLKNEWNNYNLNYLGVIWLGDNSLRYGPVTKEKFDGVLGADYLMSYERVTIDYINNYIILDDERLDGYAIPFTMTPNNEILINFTYNGLEELAMIDTGNYCFTPRHNIGDGNQNYDLNDDSTYGIGYDGKVPVTPRVMYTYNNIKIGDVSYDNIKGAYSTIRGSGFVKGSRLHMIKLNNIGNVFFYNHIIQFDFVNKEFIIK